METNLKVVVRYDGTGFAGWQVQPGMRTVQGVLEETLGRIASRPIRIHGAGRTDAGVHALGQVFSCRWPGPVDCARLRRALSGILGPELRAESVEVVDDSFHARRSAVGKRYAYTFAVAREADPFSARYAWTLPWKFDLDKLAALSQTLVGERDFAGFQSSRAGTKTTVRTIHSIELRRGGVVGPLDADNLWRLEFHGNGFLYKMVRNITATLIDIVRGQIPESRLAERLASPGPFHGHTAPARGLTLVAVEYGRISPENAPFAHPESIDRN